MRKFIKLLILIISILHIGCGYADNVQNATTFKPSSKKSISLFHNNEAENETSNNIFNVTPYNNPSVNKMDDASRNQFILNYVDYGYLRTTKDLEIEENDFEFLYKKVDKLKNEIKFHQEECKKYKREFLRMSLRYDKDIEEIQKYFSKVTITNLEKFLNKLFKTIPFLKKEYSSCIVCNKLVEVAKKLENQPKELESLNELVNNMTKRNKYICYKCNLGNKGIDFSEKYKLSLKEIESKEIEINEKIKKLNILANNKKEEKKLKKISEVIKKIKSDNHFKITNNKLDDYFKFLINKIPYLQICKEKLFEVPSKEELNDLPTQIKYSDHKITCKYCQTSLGYVHLLTIKKILENKRCLKESKEMKYPEIHCPEVFDINPNFGKEEEKLIFAKGNKFGETVWVEEKCCINCLLGKETTRVDTYSG